MDIEINSTWLFNDVDGYSNGEYRILQLLYDISVLLVFRIEDSNRIIRPQVIKLVTFKDALKGKQIKRSEYLLQPYMLALEDEVADKHRKLRDKRWQQIESLIKDPAFLFDSATKTRNSAINKQAKLHGTDAKAIYRLLNLYWRYGQTVNALLPKFSNCGAKGKQKENIQTSLGRQYLSRTGAYLPSKSFVVKSNDKLAFKKALKEYHLKPNGLNLAETYKNLLRTHYQFEILDGHYRDVRPNVPSYQQFFNWSKKLFTSQETTKARTTETDYLRNKRGVEVSITDKSPVPGSCFEIDATVADVHIVSEFRRNHVIGRPTIYSIIDRASRMIVGFHVSLYYASWEAARQALVNAFQPKVEYCQKYGIEIAESDWPCAHIPQRLICDNGEMIGLRAEDIVAPMTELQFAPPYRPDCKSLVENRFKLINDKTLHRLLGSTRGGKIVRGDPDPRKFAIYTLKELTTILLQDVLEHNKQIFDELALSSRLLVENNLSPTPLNYWITHLNQSKHALKTAPEDEINARLLPKAEVSMTSQGVLFNEMYYSNDRIRQENLAAVARNHGRIKMEARINQEDSTFIYVKLAEDEYFSKCELLNRSSELAGLTMADVYYLQDWLDDKKSKQPVTVSSIDVLESKQRITKNARKQSKKAPKLKNKKERTENSRQRRLDEMERMQEEDTAMGVAIISSGVMPVSNSSNVVTLPRRKKR